MQSTGGALVETFPWIRKNYILNLKYFRYIQAMIRETGILRFFHGSEKNQILNYLKY